MRRRKDRSNPKLWLMLFSRGLPRSRDSAQNAAQTIETMFFVTPLGLYIRSLLRLPTA